MAVLRQGILADKDLVIIDLKHQVKNLRDDLNRANMDSDRKSVALLTKVRIYLSTFLYLCEMLIFWTFTEKRGRRCHKIH